jgi:hypothetical protein
MNQRRTQCAGVSYHPQLRAYGELIDILSEAARESARQLARSYREATRQRIGSTLRPGSKTPLWNALVAEARPLLRRHGEKAVLARLLGLPRQRVHDFLVGHGRMPDAERTLLLIEWIAARQRPSAPKPIVTQ